MIEEPEFALPPPIIMNPESPSLPAKKEVREDKDKNKEKQGASRFFYCPKVSKKERNAGLEDLEEKLKISERWEKKRMPFV